MWKPGWKKADLLGLQGKNETIWNAYVESLVKIYVKIIE
jgi:hypothetical protein